MTSANLRYFLSSNSYRNSNLSNNRVSRFSRIVIVQIKIKIMASISHRVISLGIIIIVQIIIITRLVEIEISYRLINNSSSFNSRNNNNNLIIIMTIRKIFSNSSSRI